MIKDLKSEIPTLHGDTVQIQQVILNLLINALDALKDQALGSRHILLSTRDAANNGVSFSITDSGPGLDPDQTKRIFNPFYTTKTHGMGLGLPICRSIAEAHGGNLWAENHDDGGAKFTLWFPVVEEG